MRYLEKNEKNWPKQDSFGDMLRYWRKRRGRSQLDLSLDSGVSQRHISFIESGRSKASRDMVLDLSRALDIPFRERNLLLLAAGFAPAYKENQWENEDMKPLRAALDVVLQNHDPHPAVVMDRYWNVLMTNKGAQLFFNKFVDLSARTGPRNILHLMCDPDGMRPYVVNWEEVVSGLLQRVRQEAVGRVIDKKTQELLKDLMIYPDVATVEAETKSFPLNSSPVIPIHFRKGNIEQRYFSMVTTVGTPMCVTSQEFRIECMFPFTPKTI